MIFDNRHMAAISNLRHAQYGAEFRTSDTVAVDYVQLAGAVQGVNALYGGEDTQTLHDALQTAH